VTFSLEGRVAVVTGGGRGLGRAIAQGLAAHGAQVVLAGRTQATLAVQADISREPDILALRDAALARFGQLDILVNNAGVNPIYRGAVTPT